MDNSLLDGLRRALELSPDNVPLRKHYAALLLVGGKFEEAEKEYRELLALNPADEEARFALAQAYYGQEKWMVASVVLEQLIKNPAASVEVLVVAARTFVKINQMRQAAAAFRRALDKDPSLSDAELQEKLTGVEVPQPAPEKKPAAQERVTVPLEEWSATGSATLERSKTTFEDVGGMDKLKDEIRMKIIYPLTKPELYKAYGKVAGGGILMYGPPGCGKTHLARATAGEVNAYFLSIGLHDVLNMYLGQSEQNLHQLFEVARRYAPCVVFIDEVDALGASRSDMRQSAGRLLINQFLTELDGIDASNSGMLILAATNAPWHLDPALRRPGRFDRVLFVPPPDLEARTAILHIMLKDKPMDGVQFEQIARKTDGFSGADLMAVVDHAVEAKLREALRQGNPVPLNTKDLLRAATSVKPSTKDWFATARNYALYSNQSGAYDDVIDYLKLDKNSDLFPGRLFRRNNE